MDRGWIKLYRRVEDSPVWADDHLFKLFTWILLRVTRKSIALSVPTGRGTQIVNLQPGQAMIGRKTLSDKLRWPEGTTRHRLARLVEIMAGDLAIQPATHYSILTLRNHEVYQGAMEGERPGNRPGNRPSKGQPMATNKNEEKEKNTYTSLPSADAPGPPALIPQEEKTPLEGPPDDKGNGKAHPIPRGRKPRKEYPKPVQNLYETYRLNIIDVPAKKADALRNIAARLREGYTPEQLTGAVERYFEERQGNSDALPFHANNFFGQKAYFLGYLTEAEPATPEAVHG